jgi:hypothetical protein
VTESGGLPLKQAHYRATGSATRSIVICPCSRLTSGQSDLIDRGSVRAYNIVGLVLFMPIAFGRACSVHSMTGSVKRSVEGSIHACNASQSFAFVPFKRRVASSAKLEKRTTIV